MSEYKKKSTWLVINLDYVLKNYYHEFKCNFNKTLQQSNKTFDWGCYETTLNNCIDTNLILEITNELIKGIKQKIQSLISFAQITDNNCVILIHQEYDTIELNNWRNLISNDFNFNHLINDTNTNFNFKTLNQLVEEGSLLINYLQEKYVYITSKNNYINDVIAIVTKTIEKKNNYNCITIISNDSDVYQLLNDRITVLNIYCDEDTTRILSSSEVNLWYHIINGYKNLNISPIMFKTSQIYDFIKETNNYHPIIKNENSDFRQLNKREVYYVLHHLTDFKKFIENTPDFILNQQHIINQKLLDFNTIPDELYESIKNTFLSILQNKIYIASTNKNSYNNGYIQSIQQIKHNQLNCEKNNKFSDKLKKKNEIRNEIINIKATIKKTNNVFSILTVDGDSE